MTHTCPACGHEWECECADTVQQQHIAIFGTHPEEIACSLKCARQLSALVTFLGRRI